MRVSFASEILRRESTSRPIRPGESERGVGRRSDVTRRAGPSKELWLKIYDGTNLRNVALVGHGHTGKTQLVSALLFTAGMVNRLGKVDEGTSITDYDEEEIQRKFSISAALAHAEWGKTKINFIDTPGYNIFLHETEAALVVADAALLVVHGVAGVEVQTEKTWGFCERYGLPRAFVVNQMD